MQPVSNLSNSALMSGLLAIVQNDHVDMKEDADGEEKREDGPVDLSPASVKNGNGKTCNGENETVVKIEVDNQMEAQDDDHHVDVTGWFLLLKFYMTKILRDFILLWALLQVT